MPRPSRGVVFFVVVALPFLLVAEAEDETSGTSSLWHRFKWGQTKTEVYVGLKKSGCKSTDTDVGKIASQSIILGCKDSEKVEVPLREDVDPVKSRCKVGRGGSLECLLAKKHPDHYWDRLTASPPREGVKPPAIDWDRWPEDFESTDNTWPEDPYDALEAKGIAVPSKMTQQDVLELFRDAETKGAAPSVFADLRYPWCRHCDYAARGFADAATRMMSSSASSEETSSKVGVVPPPTFARLDALNEHRLLARETNATCSYSCKILALPMMEWINAPSVDGNLDIFHRLSKPAVTVLDSRRKVMKAAKKRAPALALLAVHSDVSQKFEDLAAQFWKDDISFYKLNESTGDTPVPQIFAFAKGDEDPLLFSDVDTDFEMANNLTKFAAVATSPLVSKFRSFSELEYLKRAGVPAALRLVSKNTSSDTSLRLVQVLNETARALRGVAHATLEETRSPLDFGSLADDAFVVELDATDYQSKKYLYDDVERGIVTPDTLAAWVKQALKDATGMRRALRSAEPPIEEQEKSNGIQKLVSATLPEFLKSAPEALLLVSLSWDPASAAQRKAFEAIGRAVASSEETGVAAGEIVSGTNELDLDLFFGPSHDDDDDASSSSKKKTDKDAKGVWLFSSASVSPTKFTGSYKKSKTLTEWVLSTSTMLSADSEEASEKNARTARVRAALETAAHEAKLRSQERKRLEAEIDAMEPEVVVDGVSKRTYVKGLEDAPIIQNGDVVDVHYVGTYKSSPNKQFDSSRKRGEPFTVVVGQGRVIPCWDVALATMRLGDRAKIECAASMAYGDHGKVAGDLDFDVEILAVKPKGDEPPDDDDDNPDLPPNKIVVGDPQFVTHEQLIDEL